MTTVIKVFGLPEALEAFRALPRRFRNKHLRIALNAGGGVIRDRAASLARRESGLLSKSLGVKVTIPDASYNEAHHGKPAYAVIGPKRKSGRMMRINKQNNLRGFGAAQKALVAERKRLAAGKIGKPLERERAAVKATLSAFGDVVYRNPSRYAHLVEKGHGGPHPAKAYPFLSAAVAQVGNQAIAKMEQKLGAGLNEEAAKLGQAARGIALHA